jgi:serine/threonine protein kinase, bacterial
VNPQRLGSRYLLHDQIGTGGMGTVWRGRDVSTGTWYAIKLLRQEYAADPAAVARFVSERTALIRFRHPNVVWLRDMIVEDDRMALVMELVTGGDLEVFRKVSGGRLTPGVAARLGAQICAGLAAAHAAGIVHRDLKPANVLLDRGQVKLADFGIARIVGDSRTTTTGVVIGTSAYMAPEIFSGVEPAAAADVYATGITLYELLSGSVPFTGHAAAVMQAHLQQMPQRPPMLPDPLWDLISACLRKDPAARPGAAELATALGPLASPVGPLATPPGPVATPAGPVAVGLPPGGLPGPVAGPGGTAVMPPGDDGQVTMPAHVRGQDASPADPGGRPSGPSGPGPLAQQAIAAGSSRWRGRRMLWMAAALVVAAGAAAAALMVPHSSRSAAALVAVSTGPATGASSPADPPATLAGHVAAKHHPHSARPDAMPSATGHTSAPSPSPQASPSASASPSRTARPSPAPRSSASSASADAAWRCGPLAQATLDRSNAATGQTIQACIRISDGSLELEGIMTDLGNPATVRIGLVLKNPEEQDFGSWESPICTSSTCTFTIATEPSAGSWTVLPKWYLNNSYEGTGHQPPLVWYPG